MPNLVSILIPAFDAGKWIRGTIESALGQTWGNKEIIIVDDGSSDNTLSVMKEYESKSVRIITQENRGASAARNKALEFAQGDYIQWLDADDLLEPNKIKRQIDALGSIGNPKILASSPFGMFYHEVGRAKFRPTPLWQDLTPIEWFLYKLRQNLWMNPAT